METYHLEAETTVVVANPAAAGGRVGRRWPVIDTLIKRSLGPVKVLQTQAMGDGVALARKAVSFA